MAKKILTLLALAFLVSACAKPAPPPPPPPEPAGPTPGSPEDFRANVPDTVYFSFDSSRLDADARAVLERQTMWLTTYPTVPVVVEGHTDDIGAERYNMALGLRRAKAVARYLNKHGVATDRLTTVSYGETRPAVPNDSSADRALNRRAVTIVAR